MNGSAAVGQMRIDDGKSIEMRMSNFEIDQVFKDSDTESIRVIIRSLGSSLRVLFNLR
jgi:hypothetical protein